MAWYCDTCLLVLDDEAMLLEHVAETHLDPSEWGTPFEEDDAAAHAA